MLFLGVLWDIQLLVVLPAVWLMVLGLAHGWQKHALNGVSYRRRFHYTRAFPGETVALRLEVENRKILPISWLRIDDLWAKEVAPVDEQFLAPSHLPSVGYFVNVFSLRWYEKTRRSYELLFRKRGLYTIGPARLGSGDLFGFHEQTREDAKEEYLTVFPSLALLDGAALETRDPFGDRRTQRRLYEDPNQPMGVRDYHPEDGFRRIHWQATARTGKLQAKVYQPASGRVMVLCLNVATLPHYWEGVYPALMEHLVSVAAALVDRGIKNGYQIGIISNGCLAHSDQPFRIPPGRSLQQLSHLLEALAAVTPISKAPFSNFLLAEIPRTPYGATLIVLTSVTPPELLETLVQLKRHEHRLILISLAENPPPFIPGVQVIHLPFQDPGCDSAKSTSQVFAESNLSEGFTWS